MLTIRRTEDDQLIVANNQREETVPDEDAARRTLALWGYARLGIEKALDGMRRAAGEPVAENRWARRARNETPKPPTEAAVPKETPPKRARSRKGRETESAAAAPPVPAPAPEALGMPSEPEQIAQYLAAIIPGVGPSTARKVVEAFGDDIYGVLQHQPETLQEVFGPRLGQAIHDHFHVDRSRRMVQQTEMEADPDPETPPVVKEEAAAEATEADPEREALAHEMSALEGIGISTATRLIDQFGGDPKAVRDAIENAPEKIQAAIGAKRGATLVEQWTGKITHTERKQEPAAAAVPATAPRTKTLSREARVALAIEFLGKGAEVLREIEEAEMLPFARKPWTELRLNAERIISQLSGGTPE